MNASNTLRHWGHRDDDNTLTPIRYLTNACSQRLLGTKTYVI